MASMANKMTLAAVALLLVTAALGGVRAEDECCSTCIGKVSASVYDYDPLVFAQCGAKNVSRVCCFNCGSLGEPQYGDTIAFASDGTTPTVKTGTWIKMKWADAKNVTYIALKDGQKKTNTPTVSDAAATVKSGYFMICANSVGKVVFRGWGAIACRSASLEKSVTVRFLSHLLYVHSTTCVRYLIILSLCLRSFCVNVGRSRRCRREL